MAQRNGTATQTAARQAIAIAMNLDSHFELRQSTFSTAAFSLFYSPLTSRLRAEGVAATAAPSWTKPTRDSPFEPVDVASNLLPR